jgi:hypothetical protein
VDGQLPADAMRACLDAPQPGSTVCLFAATQLHLPKAGPVKLKFIGPADAPIWINGKPAKSAAEIEVDLPAGPATFVVRLDPKRLPDSLGLEASEGTFLANF